MPTLVYSEAGHDAIFSVILSCIIEFLIIILITCVIAKCKSDSFFALLKAKIGVLSYVIYFILALLLLFRVVYCFQEAYSFFLEMLYDDLNIFTFALPSLFVAVFLCMRGISSIGRTLEIIIWIILFGIILAMISNIEYIDLKQNMPYFENGLTPMLNGSMRSLFLFSSSLGLVLLVGKVEVAPNFVRNTAFFCGIGMLFMILCCFIFYSVFGNSIQYVLFSLSEYSQFDPYILELQRLIWLTAILDVTKLFCACLCLNYLLNETIMSSTKIKNPIIPLATISIVILVLGYITHFDTIVWFNITKSILSFVAIGLILIISLICIIILARKR